MCCGLEYYKEQDGTFFLALPLREICCWMFSLRAECGIPQCFSRKLPEKNNHTSSVICWHEGQEHTNCLDLASCLLFRNQTAGITDSLPETPWDILDYSSTIKISLYGVLLCFLKAHFSSLCIPETKGIRKSMDQMLTCALQNPTWIGLGPMLTQTPDVSKDERSRTSQFLDAPGRLKK